MVAKVLKFIASFASFFVGWMLAEGGIFAVPGIWLADTSDSQLVKALGTLAGLALSFIGFGLFLLPLLFQIGLLEEEKSKHKTG